MNFNSLIKEEPVDNMEKNNHNPNTNSQQINVNNGQMMPHHVNFVNQIEPSFDPISRSRSNTWPLPCENFPEEEAVNTESQAVATAPVESNVVQASVPKKNTSRRNPWGNKSYADLIADAINSSENKRATLSQIYDWMVANVPYFKDKGDSNSSAGWKVSFFILTIII